MIKEKGGYFMEAKAIRARARQSLSGNWPVSIGVAVVACLLGGMLTGSRFLPETSWEIPVEFLEQLDGTFREGIRRGSFRISFRDGIFGFAAFLLGGVIQLGYADFLLQQHDGKNPHFNELFSHFDPFGRGFAQFFLRTLYVFLWSLLLIIPGIIAGLSYSMTPFLMAENPGLSPSEAIARSKQMMDGHKMELFILDLTFLGWSILAAMCGNLGYLLLNPYTNAARAVFYRNLQKEWR